MEQQTEQNVSNELLAMAQVDRDMRNSLREGRPWDPTVDERNTKRMHEIVDQSGWPKVSDVGEDAASAAWLLVQHADLDPAFQVRCLDLIHELPEGEISPTDLAYLEDRVRVNTGRPQLYGSQFTVKKGAFGPQPIEDPDHLDERRASVGLTPFSEYETLMRDIYQKDEEGKHTHGNI